MIFGPISTNYGLAGGRLDATKHIEAAIPKLLRGGEQTCWRLGEADRACRLDQHVARLPFPGRTS